MEKFGDIIFGFPKDLLIGIPEEKYIRYKQQEEELENLRKIEKEHQKLNGELREEIKRLNNIINELEKDIENQIIFCTNEANGTTNDKYCRIAINYLKHLKDKLLRLLDKKVD